MLAMARPPVALMCAAALSSAQLHTLAENSRSSSALTPRRRRFSKLPDIEKLEPSAIGRALQ